MHHIVGLPNGKELKFYYNKKVYNPAYSSINNAILANGFIFGRIKVLDVATGCGFIGLTLKAIHPDIDVTLTDIDPEACRIAKLNAKRLGLRAEVKECSLIPMNFQTYHIITANLPTYTPEQMESEELHGPEIAYAGGKDSMHLYSQLLKQAVNRCGILICEVQPMQQSSFKLLCDLNGWEIAVQEGDSYCLIRAGSRLEEFIKAM